MKRKKKFFSILIAMMVAMMLAPHVSATETNAVNITVQGGASGSTYVVYRLLDLSTTTTDSETTNYAYTVYDKYREVLQNATSQTADGDIVLYIEKLKDTDIQTFANTVYTNIFAKNLAVEAIASADTQGNAVFKNMEQGYYLIAESKPGGNGDAYSLVMLQTLGKSSITVSTKESVPTLTKKVKADNANIEAASAWSDVQDAADYDIGDDVPFQLTGTLPDNIKSYEEYVYTFHDTLSAGFTYNQGSVKFYYVQDNQWTDLTNYTYTSDEDNQQHKAFTTTVVKNDDGTTLTFALNAIHGLVEYAKTGDTIVARYTAKLTGKNVVLGSAGNPNEAWLEYSNDPYDSSKTTTSVHDKVKVFTYQVIVNKTDEENNPLQGAAFTLTKKEGNNWKAVSSAVTGETGTIFTFKGLDAGTYKLEETTVPEGYHKANDLIFEIEAEYELTSDDPTFKGLVAKDTSGTQISVLSTDENDGKTFVVNLSEGSLTTNVINETGTLLPSTGGMGTKVFTVVGILLMLSAGVLFITRFITRRRVK